MAISCKDHREGLELAKNNIAMQQYEALTNKTISTEVLVKNRCGPLYVVRDYFKVNLAKRFKQEEPPQQFPHHRVFLGARIVEHPLARRLGIRHLYIKIFEYPYTFSIIEGLPYLSDNIWLSGAWVKENRWETRGITWELIPQNYDDLITRLKHMTQIYHDAQIPYNVKRGPNSNSFIGWLLNCFGLDIPNSLTGLTYWGATYWRDYPLYRSAISMSRHDKGVVDVSAR